MMSQWEIDELLERTTRAAANQPSTASELFACPPAEPTYEHRQLLEECVQRARAAGLRLPRCRVRWVHGREDIVTGATRSMDDNGEVQIALSVYVSQRVLALTIFHELKHASDFASEIRYSREELEVRAEAFAAQMMQQW
jgi:hypothetical protein